MAGYSRHQARNVLPTPQQSGEWMTPKYPPEPFTSDPGFSGHGDTQFFAEPEIAPASLTSEELFRLAREAQEREQHALTLQRSNSNAMTQNSQYPRYQPRTMQPVQSPPPQQYYGRQSSTSPPYQSRAATTPITGNEYGETIIKGRSSVLQGNLFDTPEPPKNMTTHRYVRTLTEDDSQANLLQGHANAAGLQKAGFWRKDSGRTRKERRHQGDKC